MNAKPKTIIDWYCDQCGEYMNNQVGFTTSSGSWTCTTCKYNNNVTNENIIWNNEEIDDMFTTKKEHKTDFELADFCRGGDLTED